VAVTSAHDVISIEVRGRPVPQGSGRSFVSGDRAVHVTTSPPLLAWRGAIATEARAAMDGRPLLAGPVHVAMVFRPAERPASHFLPANSRRPVRVLRLDAPVYHTGRPDGDKLARACLDALSFVVYRDDGQAASLRIIKRWPDEGEAPGVSIRVRQLPVTR
jgi:crossover junction endodeoxyribonuclease RusA